MAIRTFAEMKERVFRWTGLDQNDSDAIAIVEDSINTAYKHVLSKANWKINKKEGVFYSVAPHSTGTVTLSGTTLTGVGTSFSSSMVGRYVQIEALGEETHLISAYVSPTSLTLQESASADVASASTYSIFQSDYTLADGIDEHTLEYINDQEQGIKLDYIPDEVQNARYPNQGNLSMGVPYEFSFVGRSAQVAPVVRLYPIPSDVRAYKYVGIDRVEDLSDADDVPVISERFQDVLDEGAKELVFMHMGKADRAKYHGERYADMLTRMLTVEKGPNDFSYKFEAIDQHEQLSGLRLPPNFPARRH